METIKIAEVNTFSELAKLYGCKVKAKAKLAHPPLVEVQDKLGNLCAVLWSYIQEREYCKRYGDKGQHILTPAALAEWSGFPLHKVEPALIRLLCGGFIRSAGPNAVRAA
jgi:hypothetical protein